MLTMLQNYIKKVCIYICRVINFKRDFLSFGFFWEVYMLKLSIQWLVMS